MPVANVSAAIRHSQQIALERIRRLTCAGLDVAGFLEAVNPIVCQLVPNGTETIESPFWYTVDPASHLVTSIYGQGCDLDPSAYMQWELLADDVMKSADVLRNPRRVQTLHEVTNGEPERSPIYREVMVEHGMAQELLVALATSSGQSWGTARLNRAPGEPMFAQHEIAFMALASSLLAEGVRWGLLVGEATDPERPDSPGLVVMAGDGEVESFSFGAPEWFDRLPDDDGRQNGVPTSVLAVASAALAESRESGTAGAATARVRTVDGGWAVVHGAVMGTNADSRVTVIIQPAHPDRIAPLLMSIYDLTDREQEVTQLVLRGGSTTHIARDLGVSPHTVQQHLKSIFEKTGVNSRGELVATIYLDCYDLRTRDNRERIQATEFIRGGPKRSGAVG